MMWGVGVHYPSDKSGKSQSLTHSPRIPSSEWVSFKNLTAIKLILLTKLKINAKTCVNNFIQQY
jgi:hypothetical protein